MTARSTGGGTGRKATTRSAGRGSPGAAASQQPAATVTLIGRAGELAAGWGPTAGRVLLGVVLAWFGYHELIQPSLWTGYIPFVHTASAGAVVLVLAHGWLLLVLAVALIAGIAARAAAGLAALLVAQIVIWLWASAGLSDLTLRDVGVLGLALCLVGRTDQRLSLTS